MTFNIGYLLGHLPFAILCNLYGPRSIMMICVFCSSILTIFLILAAKNYMSFLILRGIIGFFNGPLYPIVHQIVASYCPPTERTYMLVITYSGNIMSLLLTFPVGGYILDHIVNGWRLIFWLTGTLGMLSLVLWYVFVFSEPEENTWLSPGEILLINTSIYPHGKNKKRTISSIPFGKIFMSRHLYIFTMAHFAKMFIVYFNLFGIVKFLCSYFHLSRSNAGYISTIPFIVDFFGQISYPYIAQKLRNSSVSNTNFRKFNTLIGGFGSSCFLIGVSHVAQDNYKLAVFLLSVSLCFVACYQAGYFTAIIDYAPQYSAITMAFINIGGSLSGFLQRLITGLFFKKYNDINLTYKYSLWVTGLASMFLCLPYVLFGTSDLAAWAEIKKIEPSSFELPEIEKSQDGSATSNQLRDE